MKILHFADVHIGVENYSRTDPDTGLSTRLQDFLETFDELVDYAIGSDVHLALFCGDAYKSRDPSQTQQREFAKRIVRLSEAGIPSFLLIGNHDTPHVQGRATALDIYRTLPTPRVTIGDHAATYLVETAAGPLQIVATPWIRRSQFLAREEMRGLSTFQINEKISDTLTNIIQTQAERLDPDIPAVLSGHVTVNDARTSSEQSMMLGSDHVLLRSSVALPQFDYVALGHIHKHQVIGQNPHVVYPGSLQRIDFGEERDEKGFCVVELDPSEPQGQRMKDFRFQPVNARRFLTIDVKLGADDPASQPHRRRPHSSTRHQGRHRQAQHRNARKHRTTAVRLRDTRVLVRRALCRRHIETDYRASPHQAGRHILGGTDPVATSRTLPRLSRHPARPLQRTDGTRIPAHRGTQCRLNHFTGALHLNIHAG